MLAQGNSSFHFLSQSLKIKKMDDCMQTLTGKASYKGPLALSQTPSCTKIPRQLSLSAFFSSCKSDMLFQPINRFFSPSSHIVRQELFLFLLHNIFGEKKHWMSTQTSLFEFLPVTSDCSPCPSTTQLLIIIRKARRFFFPPLCLQWKCLSGVNDAHG